LSNNNNSNNNNASVGNNDNLNSNTNNNTNNYNNNYDTNNNYGNSNLSSYISSSPTFSSSVESSNMYLSPLTLVHSDSTESNLPIPHQIVNYSLFKHQREQSEELILLDDTQCSVTPTHSCQIK
jgi:hypothetical protein